MVYRADDDAALHSVTTTALAERFAREPVGRLACLRRLFISGRRVVAVPPEGVRPVKCQCL